MHGGDTATDEVFKGRQPVLSWLEVQQRGEHLAATYTIRCPLVTTEVPLPVSLAQTVPTRTLDMQNCKLSLEHASNDKQRFPLHKRPVLSKRLLSEMQLTARLAHNRTGWLAMCEFALYDISLTVQIWIGGSVY